MDGNTEPVLCTKCFKEITLNCCHCRTCEKVFCETCVCSDAQDLCKDCQSSQQAVAQFLEESFQESDAPPPFLFPDSPSNSNRNNMEGGDVISQTIITESPEVLAMVEKLDKLIQSVIEHKSTRNEFVKYTTEFIDCFGNSKSSYELKNEMWQNITKRIHAASDQYLSKINQHTSILEFMNQMYIFFSIMATIRSTSDYLYNYHLKEAVNRGASIKPIENLITEIIETRKIPFPRFTVDSLCKLLWRSTSGEFVEVFVMLHLKWDKFSPGSSPLPFPLTFYSFAKAFLTFTPGYQTPQCPSLIQYFWSASENLEFNNCTDGNKMEMEPIITTIYCCLHDINFPRDLDKELIFSWFLVYTFDCIENKRFPRNTLTGKIVPLKPSDSDEIIYISKQAASLSSLINTFLEGFNDEHPILVNVRTNVLKKIAQFIEYHSVLPNIESNSQDHPIHEKSTNDIHSVWDREFCNVPQSVLFEIILAAYYLNICSLTALTSKTIANSIKGKTPEEIRKFFNIKNDFTPEEEEKASKENEWASE